MTRTLIATLAAAGCAVAAAAPAAAQYRDPYPPPPPRTRAGQVADEIARTVRETAEAVATVRDSWDSSVDGIRWGRAERFAIDACRPAVERYGAMRVQRVDPYGRRSLRVYGVAGGSGGYGAYPARSGYGGPGFEGYSGYGRSAYPRSFACTVRDDGRVKVKTTRLRRW